MATNAPTVVSINGLYYMLPIDAALELVKLFAQSVPVDRDWAGNGGFKYPNDAARLKDIAFIPLTPAQYASLQLTHP